jgi:hypothetical protein
MRFSSSCPFSRVNGTRSSRGIESIEIVGLLGSMRTSSISFECGSTAPLGLPLGGGRSSLPTSSSVSGAPLAACGRMLAATFTGLFWRSAATTLLTSLRASTALAAPESSTTPIPPSSTRLAIHQGRRGGSGGIGPGGGAPSGGGGCVAMALK